MHETLDLPLKTSEHVDIAVLKITDDIPRSACNVTPCMNKHHVTKTCSKVVRENIAYKRKLRKHWIKTKSAEDKHKFNQCTKELKRLLKEVNNAYIQYYLRNLTPTNESEYSLWKATRKIKKSIQLTCMSLRLVTF